MDFARVLLVAVIIFAVLYVFFGGDTGLFAREEGFERGPGFEFKIATREKPEEVMKEGYIFVGRRKEDGTKRIDINQGKRFKVSSQERERKILNFDPFKVSKGIASSKNKRKIFYLSKQELKNMENARIKAKISSTNRYGSLIIKLNGKTIYSKSPIEGEILDLPLDINSLKKENIIEISASSSGWRIWAPTLYFLSEFKLRTNVLVRGPHSFTISVPEISYKNFNSGGLILSDIERSGKGKLEVDFNGKELYKGVLNNYKIIDLNLDEIDLKKENNVLHFSTANNTQYSLKSSLLLSWNEIITGNIGIEMNIDKENFDSLPGEIQFKIAEIYENPRALTVKIETPSGKSSKLLEKKISDKGQTVKFNFNKDNVDIGLNKLIFSVKGKGGYKLSDLKVRF